MRHIKEIMYIIIFLIVVFGFIPHFYKHGKAALKSPEQRALELLEKKAYERKQRRERRERIKRLGYDLECTTKLRGRYLIPVVRCEIKK